MQMNTLWKNKQCLTAEYEIITAGQVYQSYGKMSVKLLSCSKCPEARLTGHVPTGGLQF